MWYRITKLMPVILFVTISGCQTASWVTAPVDLEEYSPVAVIAQDLRGYGQPDSAVIRQMEDAFIQGLMAKGYGVVTRSDVSSVLEEQNFQHSHITENDAARLGAILNVPAVLLVTANNSSITMKRVERQRYDLQTETFRTIMETVYQGEASIGARKISVEDGQILGVGSNSLHWSVSGQELEYHRDLIARAARQLANELPPRFPELEETSNKVEMINTN